MQAPTTISTNMDGLRVLHLELANDETVKNILVMDGVQLKANPSLIPSQEEQLKTQVLKFAKKKDGDVDFEVFIQGDFISCSATTLLTSSIGKCSII